MNIFMPDLTKTVDANGDLLARTMIAERKAQALHGYFLDFGWDETTSHDRDCELFRTNCGHLMESARDERRNVKVFRNMNGQIAAALLK